MHAEVEVCRFEAAAVAMLARSQRASVEVKRMIVNLV
jgi:hypothetical protein